jgi:uncharacterized membrane protein
MKTKFLLVIGLLCMLILFGCDNEPSTTYDIEIIKSIDGTETKSFLKVLSEKYFSLICHQDHSTLMSVKEEAIPLCPRCMGLHIGFIISAFVLMISIKNRIRIYGSLSFIILIAGIGLIFMEWTLAQFTVYQSTILSRLLTGLVAGSIFGLLFTIYKNEFTRSVSSGHTIINASRFAFLISISLIGGVVIILSNNWTVIDISLLISVTANFILIIHTIILRFKPFIRVLIIKN